jgi:glutathione S-transferase
VARRGLNGPAPRLVTIPISHYCEKARWALEGADIAYREERHIQGIHRRASRRAGGSGTVPVLVTPERAYGDSAEILAWVDQRLPQERRLFAGEPAQVAMAEVLCARFDEVLGPAGRRLIYVRMFAHERKLALAFNNQGVPFWEDRFVRAGWPAFQRLVARALDIRPGVEAQDEDVVWREFDHVAELLADGRPYLCGERFGGADLTFAALCAPVLLPARYGVRLPQPEELDDTTAALVHRARAHPAGAFALRVIAEHRPEPVAPIAAAA